MRQSTRFLGIALVGIGALLLPLNAHANCGTSVIFGQYYHPITGTTAALRANFWTLGQGNPVVGQGADNGGIASALWVGNFSTAAGGKTFYSDWGTQLYDGCCDSAGGTAVQRMAVEFSDVGAGGVPTYAVACAHRDPTAGIQFNFDLSAPNGMSLAPAGKASITNTVRNQATGEATITVGVPDFSAAYYTDGSAGCEQSAVIPQFDVYKQQAGRGAPPPVGNDAGAALWVLVGTCSTSGSPACTITTTCGATNCDNYLAVAPHFNSNFTSNDAATGGPARVSPRSTNVQAGPTLAVTPKPKTVPNPRAEAPRTQQNQ